MNEAWKVNCASEMPPEHDMSEVHNDTMEIIFSKPMISK